MPYTHNLGFPRLGRNRDLKFALENYWNTTINEKELKEKATAIHMENLKSQSTLDFVPVGDFSLYDHILDTSFMLGNIPERALKSTGKSTGTDLDRYFRVARGRSAEETQCQCIAAGEMTKWFDTNYHYIVPEFTAETRFKLNPDMLVDRLKDAQSNGNTVKPVIVGPVTYLWLGKTKDESNRLDLLPALLQEYRALLDIMDASAVEWVQIDEPVLALDLSDDWKDAIRQTYTLLSDARVRILLTTYFGALKDNHDLAFGLPVAGWHIDAVRGFEEVQRSIDKVPADKVLSLGIVDGRTIWKTDLTKLLDWLEPCYNRLQERLWLAPSCSLLHVPLQAKRETGLDKDILSWLAFAEEKLEEIRLVAQALTHGRDSISQALAENRQAIENRKSSTKIHHPAVKSRVERVKTETDERPSDFSVRRKKQSVCLALPQFPTTTIGSFPQTSDIRKHRSDYRKGTLNDTAYKDRMQSEILKTIRFQEEIGLDVLVHGEAERNDMVEYFGEQLEGFAFTRYGWVQSYGSRCVKPPIIYGDISRPLAMTVDWTRYAQSVTNKPVKGMLTGPVTMLNWSFVRDDQPLSETCLQLSLAIRDEVLDLEKAGIKIIQIDEAALREGLPLRKADWQAYLDWAIKAFRITVAKVADETQIHTHMCYSEFNDIIDHIARMDADVISIETSRSDMELINAFKSFEYKNDIGPGVYDIHSPNIPETDEMVALIKKAADHIKSDQLWINPDCGLKTRAWKEVIPALKNMVDAATILRKAESHHHQTEIRQTGT